MSDLLKKLGNTKLRTPETWEEYKGRRQDPTGPCAMCNLVHGESDQVWSIVANEYPYDAIAEKHDLLIPTHHAPHIEDFDEAELATLHLLLAKLEDSKEYDAVLWNFPNNQTVPGHFHIHLLKWIRV